MINNFSSFNVTKLDVLSHLKEIKLGVKYTIDGKEIKYMPATLEELAKVEIVYETFKGYC